MARRSRWAGRTLRNTRHPLLWPCTRPDPPTELEIRAVAVSNTGGRRVDVRARQTIRRANRSHDTFAARSAAHVTTAYHGAARLGATSPIHACAVRARRP